MKKTGILIILLAVLLSVTQTGNTTTVFYELTDLSANRWEYNYTVVNNTLGSNIDEFTFYFDYGLYDNLVVTSPLAEWDELVFNPALIFDTPDPGIYDALTLGNGIASGEMMSGFSVSFDWLGSGTPGSQYFEVVDATTFALLDEGMTSVVPIPGAFLLMGTGLITLLGWARMTKRR